MSSKDPCKKFACKLQKCLQDNVYQPARCEVVIEELRQCCIKYSDISTVCDGIDKTKRYEHNTVDYVIWPESSIVSLDRIDYRLK